LAVAAVAAAAAAGALGFGAAPASAAVYRAYSCQTPSFGEASTRGWAVSTSAGAVGAIGATSSCSGGGGNYLAAFSGSKTNTAGTFMQWQWSPPTGVSVQSASLARYGDIKATNASAYRLETTTPKGLADSCTAGLCWDVDWNHTTNAYYWSSYFSGNTAGQPELTIRALCPSGTCGTTSSGYGATYRIYRAEFLLDDAGAPTGSVDSGTLLSSLYWRGAKTTAGMALSDAGSGVQDVALQRLAGGKWTTEQTQTAPGNKSTCTPAESTDATVSYTDTQPCERSLAVASLSWDTDQLPEGQDDYRVVATDAVGNAGVVMAARKAIVDRTPPTSDFAGLADVCTVGERLKVTPTTTDAVSGVDTVATEVVAADGTALPVESDGTIVCPSSSKGPLSSQTTAKDKAGNEATVARQTAISVQEPPAPPVIEEPEAPTDPSTPETPPTPATPDSTVGNGGTVAPQPTTPAAPTHPNVTTADGPAVQPIAAPAPPQTPAAPGKASPTAAADALLMCTRKDLLLTEAYPLGNRDVLRGVADRKLVGKIVALRYGPGHKTVAKVPVAPDGTFTAMVKAPKGKKAKGNGARYDATIGRLKAAAVKRTRRMYSTQTYRTANGAAIYLSGRVTKPFAKTTKVTVQVRRGNGCASWSSVKSVRVDRRGNYGTTIPVPSSEAAVVVRAIAQVQASAKTVRKTRTQTFPAAVQMR
jgi:hypothetical protein